jgi:uncharacterized membrane protein
MHFSAMMQGAPSPNGVDQRPAEPRNPVVVPPNGAEQRPAGPSSPAVVAPPDVPRKPLSAYLPAENVMAALSYLFGWISGIIVLLFDKRPFVRFHAAQSVIVFAALNVVLLVLGGFFLGSLVPEASSVWFVLRRIVEIVWLITAIMLILKALLGERFRMPYAARFAERAAETR